MNELIYCIECEEMVSVENILCGKGHVVIRSYPGMSELDCCEFPSGIAYCPPPEVGNWLERVGEPSQEDLQYELDLEFESLEA